MKETSVGQEQRSVCENERLIKCVWGQTHLQNITRWHSEKPSPHLTIMKTTTSQSAKNQHNGPDTHYRIHAPHSWRSVPELCKRDDVHVWQKQYICHTQDPTGLKYMFTLHISYSLCWIIKKKNKAYPFDMDAPPAGYEAQVFCLWHPEKQMVKLLHFATFDKLFIQMFKGLSSNF